MKTITKFQTIESFETSRLYARRLNEDDFNLILSTYQNEKIMQTLGGVISEEAAYKKFTWNLERWEKNGFGSWLWFEKKSKQFIGRAGLRCMELENRPIVEVGYVLLPLFWNQGFATEITSACIEIAFEQLMLKELVCFTLTTNKASQRVMEKVGFKFDHNFLYDGEPHVLYSLKNNHYR